MAYYKTIIGFRSGWVKNNFMRFFIKLNRSIKNLFEATAIFILLLFKVFLISPILGVIQIYRNFQGIMPIDILPLKENNHYPVPVYVNLAFQRKRWKHGSILIVTIAGKQVLAKVKHSFLVKAGRIGLASTAAKILGLKEKGWIKVGNRHRDKKTAFLSPSENILPYTLDTLEN